MAAACDKNTYGPLRRAVLYAVEHGGTSQLGIERIRVMLMLMVEILMLMVEILMSIIGGWIVLGLIAGFLASKIVNKQGEGLILDIVLGVVGAIVGGYLFSIFGARGVDGVNIYSMFVTVVGAVVASINLSWRHRPTNCLIVTIQADSRRKAARSEAAF